MTAFIQTNTTTKFVYKFVADSGNDDLIPFFVPVFFIIFSPKTFKISQRQTYHCTPVLIKRAENLNKTVLKSKFI